VILPSGGSGGPPAASGGTLVAMDGSELRALQEPLKKRYRDEPDAAKLTLHAFGTLDVAHVACVVETAASPAVAGLHPATGGDGSFACSGDMLLQALVACAGVTLAAVSTAMGIAIRSGEVRAHGDLDFRGTLGVARDAPVGFSAIRLNFAVDTDATDEQLTKLLQLVERYCVVYQTLRVSPTSEATIQRVSP
jgi:uncharacterized OsmC-like protein